MLVACDLAYLCSLLTPIFSSTCKALHPSTGMAPDVISSTLAPETPYNLLTVPLYVC
jgi:hypothetical protein